MAEALGELWARGGRGRACGLRVGAGADRSSARGEAGALGRGLRSVAGTPGMGASPASSVLSLLPVLPRAFLARMPCPRIRDAGCFLSSPSRKRAQKEREISLRLRPVPRLVPGLQLVLVPGTLERGVDPSGDARLDSGGWFKSLLRTQETFIFSFWVKRWWPLHTRVSVPSLKSASATSSRGAVCKIVNTLLLATYVTRNTDHISSSLFPFEWKSEAAT